MTQQAFEEMGYAQEASPAALLPTQLCYKCGGTVVEGTAFCDGCRGTALFQRVNKTRQGSEQKQEKVKMLRATISQASNKQVTAKKTGAAVGVLFVLMAFAGACGYYFMYMPH